MSTSNKKTNSLSDSSLSNMVTKHATRAQSAENTSCTRKHTPKSKKAKHLTNKICYQTKQII